MTKEIDELSKAIALGTAATAVLQKSRVSGKKPEPPPREAEAPDDDLQKAVSEVQGAADLLQKSHVEEHTRTSKSGAVTTVSAYDDKRQKAAEATETAEKNQAKHNWNDPRDTRVVASDHAQAAFAHLDALKHAATNKDINHHLHAASRHLQSNHSMHDFADDQPQPKVPLKNQSSRPADPVGARATRVSNYAKEISQAANSAADSEETAEGLNKKSSLHMLAMEQHHRAEASHMKVANQHFTSDPKKREDAMQLAQWHRDQAEKHGKEVRRLSGISISARSTAISASEKAYRTGKPEDHKAAADLHRAAVKLNYDSEGAAEGEKQAQEHDKRAAAPAEAKPDPLTKHAEALHKVAKRHDHSNNDRSTLEDAARNMKADDHASLKETLKHADTYQREVIMAHVHPDHWEGLGVQHIDKARNLKNYEQKHQGK